MKESTDNTNNGSLGGLGGMPGGGLGGDPDIIIKQEPGGSMDPTFDTFSGPDNGCPPGLQLSDDKSLINLLGEPKQGKKRKRESSSKKKLPDDCDIILDSSSDESILSKDLDFDLDLIEKKKSPPSILLDLENKNLIPPSVSITPITCNSMISPTQSLNSVLERRPGIEIIPLVQTAPCTIPSTLTVTAISSSKDDRSRKSGKSSKSDEKSRTDKKRKRRKDDSGMGPPEKVPTKQDPLTKPVTVSIKPADCGSPRSASPNSSIQKYSSSPTPLSIVSSKGSPKSVKHSPKHSSSPAYSVSSPKSSPKHGTSSPKHQGSSGKPSMSALKSAVSSPKSDSSSKKSSSSKDSSRDKERKSGSSGHQSPKLKSSTVKLKQLDLSTTELTVTTQSGGSTPPSGNGGDSKSQPMVRNRKGSLSAIVDKLKSAQHCGDIVIEGPVKSSSVKDRSGATIIKAGDKSSVGGLKPGDSKNPGEYMVKPSSDGMKITINKTRTKDPNKSSKSSSSGGSSSGSGSPKTHTGLKPGVNSGPASKKPQPLPGKGTSTKTSSKVLGASKSSSSVVKSAKSSGSRDSRPRSTKPGDKSIFSSSKSDARRMSPNNLKEDSDAYKTLTPPTISPELVVQGLMKQLDTKFQIPKLSQRTATVALDDLKKDKYDGSKTLDQSKFMDLSMKSDSKYPLIPKLDDLIVEAKQILPPQSLKNSLDIELTDESPVLDSSGSSTKDDILSSLKIELPIGSMSFTSDEPSPEVSEPIRPPDPPKTMPTPQEAAEILLDFSNLPTKSILPEKLISVPERAMASVVPLRKNITPPPPMFPASPSVSVHIVKSPAPSPLVIPSPHSASPCITDDELMDEALVGIGK